MRVTFGPAALRDLKSVLAYLAAENPYAASMFSAAITDIRERLSHFPDAGTPLPGGKHRFAIVRGFPYKVYYRAVTREEVRILRIRHARRRPLKLS
jgi:plasmid stabilization system protein ParE